MRWDSLQTNGPSGPRPGPPVLFEQGAVTRTFDTPAFRGMTFFEIQARSIINRVPDASRLPFRWTINPYRGCSHSCLYCFARKSHTYLDFDAGHDFDSKIVVKINAPELARKELAAARWRGDHIAMGTHNVRSGTNRKAGDQEILTGTGRGPWGPLHRAVNSR